MSLDLEDGDGGSLLNQPLCIGDLLKNGAKFEINTDLDDNLPDELFDDLHVDDSDDENGEEYQKKLEIIVSPWKKSFSELREHMVKVNDDIYKRIIREGNPKFGIVPDRARVVIEYDAYWEKEAYPFDSSNLRGKPHVFHCDKDEVLIGLELAVRTMLKGEKSQFLISYRLLFREMGCPPRVKPKADGLFIIRLNDFVNCGDVNALDDVPKEDLKKFSYIIDKVKDVHLKGIDLYKNGNLHGACKAFHKAVNALSFCRVSDENEQNEQEKFLIKLYINLAVCYNRLNLPTKACSMCNEIRKITNINENCKALFQEGRALFMIGEFERAKQRLVQAQKLEPNNQEINNELKLLSKKFEEYKTNELTMWRKAMQITNNVENNDKKSCSNITNPFKEKARELLKNFVENSKGKTFSLPDGLSTDEIKTFTELTEELNLKFNLNEVCNQKRYIITKK